MYINQYCDDDCKWGVGGLSCERNEGEQKQYKRRKKKTHILIQMQEVIDYNFLIIGRSGSGKSATSKLLTGDPSITVANSIHEVTKAVKYYSGITHSVEGKQIRFGILDIPGLDRIDNRFTLREVILQQLGRLNIALHGIIYIASLTERDTVDQAKLFHFVDQLPWPSELKKSTLIPIFTKYDNFIIDSPEEDIETTKQQFNKLFQEKGYATAWGKRVYWVNFTKSLDFKMKVNGDIRDKYQGQIQRLTEMIKKNKKGALSAQSIKQYIQLEQNYVMQQFLHKLADNEIPYSLVTKYHKVPLHIKIEPCKIKESLTAFSASSIGIFIARVFKHDIPFPISLVMMGIPISLTFINLMASGGQHTAEKVEEGQHASCKVISNFGKICNRINQELEEEWKHVNRDIEFSVDGKYLRCKLHKNARYKFFSLENLQIKQEFEQKNFEHEMLTSENISTFIYPIPPLAQESTWDPIISFKYEVKVFEELTIMKVVEGLRSDYNNM